MNKEIIKESPINHILIVDDEESMRGLLTKALEKQDFICKQANNAESALQLLDNYSVDLIISDILMPGMDGLDFLKKVKSKHPEIDFIIMTGYASSYSYVEIMDAGASDYMSKPFNLNSVIARINRIAREKQNLIELKKTNLELSAAIERANRLAEKSKEASKAKTLFLASMSHEIRTPLNGIVGYTDMLMDTHLDDEQINFLQNARNSCETLLSVVNDILDFSKVEAGKLTLESIEFDPEILCFDTIDVVRTKVDESLVELVCSVEDSVPGQVKGDPHRFRQVLLNLLSNAVKFTHKGRIKLSIESKKADENHAILTVTVQDTGIGIAKNKIKKIFKPFIQSEDDITSRYGGTGLGLAISRNIAREMGGDLWVESIKNKGSVFYVTFKLETVLNKKFRRIRPASLKGKKVLLASASKDNDEILKHELKLAGMTIFTMTFNELDKLVDNESVCEFDIAVVDFGKAVKNKNDLILDKFKGLQSQTCKAGFIACSIPIPGIADLFFKAGFKGFLPKPIARRKLFEMIAYVIGLKSDNKTESDTYNKKIVTTHVLSENKKYSASILLVEDNPVNQKMTSLMLSKAGYMIEIANDGVEAVEKYTQDPKAYDLIFMDINMPNMNGFEATEKIRLFEKDNPYVKKIPILALTANVFDDFKKKCFNAGMDAFLTKPIKRELVLEAIRERVKL